MNDLNFSGSAYDSINSSEGWEPIGDDDNNFTGSFSGAGHTISNLFIKGDNNDIGLFGYIHDAHIDSLSVINCNVSGNNNIGCLVGNCRFSGVSDCSATGCVSGDNWVGGLIGHTTGGSTSISNCYSITIVSGNRYIGGLLGNTSSSISNCYTTGCTSGNDYVGGLAGDCYNSTVSNCYVAGSVSGSSITGSFIGANRASSTVTNGYYNIETTGQTSGIGTDDNSQTVTGLTTLEMKQPGNFAGFNFDSVWAIRSDSTYPALLTVDNAPFAFADTITIGASFRPEKLLANDYDYETLQSSLVTIIDSASAGKIIDGILHLPDTISEGDTIKVYYRIGEKRTNDTLWGNSATSVIVAGTNSAPVISPVSLQTDEDIVLQTGINSFVSDNEEDNIDITIVDSTINGHLAIQFNILTYTPLINFNGTDSLRIIASDGLLSSDSVWIHITVNAVNDSPEITSLAPLTAIVGEEYTVIAFDIDGDDLTYSLNGQPADMLISSNIISWTPAEGTTTSGEVTLTVSDGELNATETFTISVSLTGIEDINTEGLLLYPNPVRDILTIQSTCIIEYLQLVSVNGAIVLSETVNGSEKLLDLQHLNTGIYLLQLKTSNTMVNKIICKE
jgi:hypothetical protein